MIRRLLVLISVLLLGAGLAAPADKKHKEAPVPEVKAGKDNFPGFDNWQKNMTILGKKWCDGKKYGFGWEADVWFYDGTRVYYQIADYTHDHSWDKCALNIAQQYRDYVLQNSGRVPGWRVFPRGMRMAWERTKDDSYKQAVILLSKNSAYAPRGGAAPDTRIRETAYVVEAYLEAEKVGEPRNPKLEQAVGYLLGDFQNIFVTKKYEIHQPFFDGLAAEALIDYYIVTRDAKVPPAIKLMVDGLWTKGYDSTKHVLAYNPDDQGPTCSVGCGKYVPDLTNLVAPAYAWYWQISHDDVYRQHADEMFGHSLDTNISYSGKIFSQNYRWSFDYVHWRSGGSPTTEWAPSDAPKN
jgi:hypothetical protein